MDDLRVPPPGWTLFRPYQTNDFIGACEHATHISMDHDLGVNEAGEEYLNGYQIAKIIYGKVVYNGWWKNGMPEITVHSSNPVGREDIIQTFRAIKRYLEGE